MCGVHTVAGEVASLAFGLGELLEEHAWRGLLHKETDKSLDLILLGCLGEAMLPEELGEIKEAHVGALCKSHCERGLSCFSGSHHECDLW
jgi:hypothetical protein